MFSRSRLKEVKELEFRCNVPWQIVLVGRCQSSAAKVVVTNTGRQCRGPGFWSDHPEFGPGAPDKANPSGVFVLIVYIFGSIDLITSFPAV